MPRCICGRRSRQNQTRADALAQSFMARGALCSARGLVTSAIPYGDRSFQLDFDFLDHVLRASVSDGGQEEIELYPRSVADFYAEVMRSLAELGINIRINELPNGDSRCDPLRRWHPRLLDREYAERFCAHIWFSPHAFSAGFRTRLPRQVQPGPLLLGQLRSRRDAILRAPRADVHAKRCRAQHAGGGRARCLLARMFERRLLRPGGQGVDYPAFYSYAFAIASGLLASAAIRPAQS